jgi:hypothetical protein
MGCQVVLSVSCELERCSAGGAERGDHFIRIFDRPGRPDHFAGIKFCAARVRQIED